MKMNKYVRPMMMIVIGLILFNNYVVLSYFDKVIDLPTGFYALASIFAGIYVAGRSYEKSKKNDMSEV